LGHIFENSLNEIESVNAEIEGVITQQNKKKDGVFSPKYITKYIVENTIGNCVTKRKTN
jgi:hypothetical protein